MATRMAGWGGRLRSLGLSALAMIVLISPLAMWVSWTEWMFVAVIGIGLTTGALYCLLDRSPDAVPGHQRRRPASTVTPVDDHLLAELSNLNPMIYHNRLSVERRLQNTLDKIREAVKRGDR